MSTQPDVALRVLAELLEQIDNLEGIEFTRDLEPYKAEAIWDYTLARARRLVNPRTQPAYTSPNREEL